MATTYNKWPFISVENRQAGCFRGWEAIATAIKTKVNSPGTGKKVIAIECYQGVDDNEVIPALQQYLGTTLLFSKDAMLPESAVNDLIYPDVTDDEVFGYLTRLQLSAFFDKAKVSAMAASVENTTDETVYIYGAGAALIYKPDVIVYLDMPRWEIQMRFRRNEISNLGVSNRELKTSLQYKQAFFVDWRVCDRHKKTLINKWDFVIDTTLKGDPKMVTGDALNNALAEAVNRPFRLVPFFDPGPWGGQWMKERFDLDPQEKNYAWCFDCVPEENSLLFKFDDGFIFETPSINLVFAQSRKLLGDAVQARFGEEFPIRFDFLDTMDGGNLSLQVHPTTEYIQEQFGMHYTQDESYYMLDAKAGAFVYLGLKDDISGDEMIRELREAKQGGTHFEAERFVEKWEMKKHDHVLIPAGTVHCSGKDSMVLEISATPFIFTFKLWDWGRMGLDGKPRPVNIDHGEKVIDWSRTPEFCRNELINTITTIAEGDGWKEERTGLHEREFIETRRHWFSKSVLHKGNGSVHVINLVDGEEAVVESPQGSFEPFVVHYAETFVVPAHVKEYTITPYGRSEGKMCATLKAFVRINA